MIIAWAKFFGILSLIYFFGSQATRSADVIAEKKKWGRAFMGVVFVSMITSLPELFSGISSISIVKSPDIAIGQIIGSCIFNIFIIALIELFFFKRKIYKFTRPNMLNMGFSITIISVLTLFIALKPPYKIFHIGLSSLFIFILYIFFMKVIFGERKEDANEEQYKEKSIRTHILIFVSSAVAIIFIGMYLPVVGKEIAEVMHWGDSLIGIIFIAFVTSFPELVVSFQAAKLGAFDMFIGNIAGSNLFNIAIIFIIDLFYLQGSVLLSISGTNISVGIIAILMNFVVFFALVRDSKDKLFGVVSVNAMAIIILYIVTVFVSG